MRAHRYNAIDPRLGKRSGDDSSPDRQTCSCDDDDFTHPVIMARS